MNAIACLAATFCLAGCLYLIVAIVAVSRLAARRAPRPAHAPSVTVLKPLHGDEVGLLEGLRDLCEQDYQGALQIVCGVQREDDPAIAVVEQVKRAFPDVAIDLVVDPQRWGGNGKVSNLVNMARRIRHEVVVLSDSDIRVPKNWLTVVVGALLEPGIGGVTCLYGGASDVPGPWAALAKLQIDTHFLPSVAVGYETGMAHPCLGSTIALRRETLDRIGGFLPLADGLADDYALGAAIRAHAGPVAIPAIAVGHACPESTFAEMWHHELRWSRTIRSIDPRGHLGSILTHPLPFAILWLAVAPSLFAMAAIAATLTCRIALCMRIEQALKVERPDYRWIPVRDCLSFAVFLASFAGRDVRWRGQDYSVVRDGALTPNRRTTPS